MNIWPWSRIRELERSERAAVQAAADDRRALELERAARELAEAHRKRAANEVQRQAVELDRLRKLLDVHGVSEPPRTPPASIQTRHARAKHARRQSAPAPAAAQPARTRDDDTSAPLASMRDRHDDAPAFVGAGGAFGGAGASASWDSDRSDTSNASDGGSASSND